MRVALAVLATIICCSHALARSPFTFGAPARVELPFSGCRDLRIMNRIAELVLEDDVDAAVKVAIRAGNQCRYFKKGEAVRVEDYSVPHSLSCVRLKGDPDCFWFPSNFLRKISD